MMPAREFRKHENDYHDFVKLVAAFTGVVLAIVAIVIGLISH